MNNESNIGYIIFRVSTARGAIPLMGAEITIRNDETGNFETIATVVTDNSGQSERIALPTRAKELSEVPGNKKPYTTYNIEVRADGYYNQFFNNVPVFEGITSYQAVDMIPLSDTSYTDNYTFDPIDSTTTPTPEL